MVPETIKVLPETVVCPSLVGLVVVDDSFTPGDWASGLSLQFSCSIFSTNFLRCCGVRIFSIPCPPQA